MQPRLPFQNPQPLLKSPERRINVASGDEEMWEHRRYIAMCMMDESMDEECNSCRVGTDDSNPTLVQIN